MPDYKTIIEKLDLKPHPEGGYFSETYRSDGIIPKDALGGSYSGDRNYSTLIYYLLNENDISCFHRLLSDETWHFYEGSSLLIYIIDNNGKLNVITLGNDIENGEVFHTVIKAGCWFGAELVDKSKYSLAGCTVAPGFHFDDFELADRSELISKYPQLEKIIIKLTK